MKTFDSQELERLIKGHCKGELDSVRIHDFIRQFTAVDRNQAYTSLVEGIEGKKLTEECDELCGGFCSEMGCRSIENAIINETLKDILENVVKPLYGKE